MCLPPSVAHCLDCGNHIVSLEIRVESSYFTFLLQNDSKFSTSLLFHINPRMILYICVKSLAGVLHETSLSSCEELALPGWVPVPEHRMSPIT